MFKGTIEQSAAEAERLLAAIAPGAVCVAQVWDRRIDCLVKLPDGSVIGEMVSLSALTEERIRAAGDRLRRRARGENVPLVNELRAPVRIVPSSDS